MRFLALFVTILSCCIRAVAQTADFATATKSPKYEVRAAWLATIGGIDWPRSHQPDKQKQELIAMLDQLKAAGINTLLIQVRVRATAIYPSPTEPWETALTGTPGRNPGYDPLQFCIDECHRRGMECHAWVVTLPIGKWNKIGCTQLRKKHPKLVKRIKDEAYMDPENPQTATYLADLCRDIVRRYDVDGIHLDYIRYPETWKLRVSKEKGRQHITNIVRAINKAVKAEKPWVKLSCSPIGKHDNLTRYSAGGWNARTAVCQDAQAWLKEGLMDQLYPMMYFRDNQFFPFAIDWQEHSYGRTIVPGLGIYFLDPKEGKWTLDIVERQLHVLRQLGLGHCYFRTQFFTNNTQGIYQLGSSFDATPALIPPMTWAGKPLPSPPTSLTLNGQTLSWLGARDNSGGPNLLYNLYASADYPVDITQAENLVATRLTNTWANVLPHQPGSPQMNFAVTAVDRYGQESDPIQLLLYDSRPAAYSMPTIAKSDGQAVALPKMESTLDADYIVVETLMGQSVAVRPFAPIINISDLPDGIYQLRSLGRKGRNHRLGFFAIKRSE